MGRSSGLVDRERPAGGTARRAWSPRQWFSLHHNLRAEGGIYGTLVAAAVLAAEAGTHHGTGQVALVVFVTLTVYWFSHGYAHMLYERAQRISEDGKAHAFRDLGAALRSEWPIVGGCLGLLTVLLGAALLGADTNTAMNLALSFAVAELLIWGLIAARAAALRPALVLAYGFGSAGLGLIVTSLKMLLH